MTNLADLGGTVHLEVEEPLFQMPVTGRGQDELRWPMRLAGQLVYLAPDWTA